MAPDIGDELVDVLELVQSIFKSSVNFNVGSLSSGGATIQGDERALKVQIYGVWTPSAQRLEFSTADMQASPFSGARAP